MYLCKVKSSKMAKKKILFINQEISPYVPDNALSIMGRELPKTIQERSHEIRTFMPKWGIINDTDHPLIIKVASIQSAKVQVYFIDNDDYFGKRLMEKDEQGEDYADNGERAIFFARGVLETVKKLRWVPDVIHCQGWMSAVVPIYVKTAYQDEPSFADAKVVTSLFSQKLDKNLADDFKQCLEFRETTQELLKGYKDKFDFVELGKMAIDYSDGIVQSEALVNDELLAYTKEKNIPFLGYSESVAEACEDFYESLFPAEE